MLAPVALLTPLLAVWSDDDQASDLEEVFQRANLLQNWNLLLEQVVGGSLADVDDVEKAERACEAIGNFLDHLQDWMFDSANLDDSFQRLSVFFAVHRAAVQFENELHLLQIFPGRFAKEYFDWTRGSSTAFEPKYSPFFGMMLIEIDVGQTKEETARLVRVFRGQPNARIALGLQSSGYEMPLAWDSERMIVGEVDDKVIVSLRMVPLSDPLREEVLDAILWQSEKLAKSSSYDIRSRIVLASYDIRSRIVLGMASAYYADAWQDFAEDQENLTNKRMPNGRKPLKVPFEAWVFVKELYEQMVTDNPHESLEALCSRCDMDPNDFGQKIAYEAMGHGISVRDDCPQFEAIVPEVENTLRFDYYYLFEPYEL